MQMEYTTLPTWKNPGLKIGHDSEGNHNIFENQVLSLGASAQFDDSFTGVKIWRAEISNREMPLMGLGNFEKDFTQFLNLRESFLSAKLLKNARPIESQSDAEIVAENANDDLVQNYQESKAASNAGGLESNTSPEEGDIVNDIGSGIGLIDSNINTIDFDQVINRLRARETPVTEAEINTLIEARNNSASRSRFQPSNPSTSPTSLYKIWDSGNKADRYNIMVAADGYANTEEDRSLVWTFINEKILDGFCNSDIQPSYLNAVNIYFLDSKSAQSGITQSSVTLIPKTELWGRSCCFDGPFILV